MLDQQLSVTRNYFGNIQFWKSCWLEDQHKKWFSYFFNFLSCRWCQEGCLLRWISQIIRKVLSVLAVLLPINFERVEKSVLKEFTVLNGSVSSGSINFQMDQFFRKLTLSCIILKNGHSYFKTILLCEQLWF